MTQPDCTETGVGIDARCPVCAAQSYVTAEIRGWGVWLRCRNCTLEFVHPLEVGNSPTELYQAAYFGEESRSDMQDYAKRVRMRKSILSGSSLSLWTPAFSEIMRWLNDRFGEGTTVLELGCALGFFLHVLKRQGFRAVGLDVAEIPVILNRQDGFEVWHGSLESMPNEWVQPEVVISLFVLHHLEDPLTFLRTIRDRWPNAPLVLALHGPSSFHSRRSLPPRSLTRWNTQAVSEVLKQVGYVVKVQEIPSRGGETIVFGGWLVRSFTWLLVVPVIFRSMKLVSNVFLPKFLKPFSREANVLLIFAEPNQNSSNRGVPIRDVGS